MDNKEYAISKTYNSSSGNYTDSYTYDKAYTPEGYVTTLSNPQYYYFRKDHLGNNREVWLANTGATIQRTQYYPSGLPWADGLNPEAQNKKYNGKEFVEAHGYDTYDIVWRQYYPAIVRFQTIDPEAEEDYDISPYAMCGDNMVINIDEDGRIWDTVLDVAFTLYDIGEAAYQYNKTGQVSATTKAALAADALAIVIPGVTGAGIGVRVAAHTADAVKTAEHVADVVKTGEKVKDAVKVVNGNSKLSEKAQHVYTIVNKTTNKVEKVGISGGKVSKAGDSYRATRQVNKLNKAGGNYTSKIVKEIPAGKGARKTALKAEKAISKKNAPLNPQIHKIPKVD